MGILRSQGSRVVLTLAALLAFASARPYAGSWNDGSRLAQVESLVDRQTLSIDDSIYITPSFAPTISPYPNIPGLRALGSYDKLFINGHYYSDKSPAPQVLMAGVYQLWRWLGGASAANHPDYFALLLTWIFMGVPFVFSVWCILRIGHHLDLPTYWCNWLAASFAFGSLALPYSTQVNSHLLLLAAVAGVAEVLFRPGRHTAKRALLLGCFTGLGYTCDLGAGPPLTALAFGWVVWNGRGGIQGERLHIGLAFLLGAVPWLVLHHYLNYQIGGTFFPANSYAEYLQWPGSPFQGEEMTGHWSHSSPLRAIVYLFQLMLGRKGILLYTPALLLALWGCLLILRKPHRERSALILLYSWGTIVWLLYAATSHNSSGHCLSVRWFVPLLIPGFAMLASLLKHYPIYRTDFLLLTIAGFALMPEMLIRGPWTGRMLYTLWPVTILLLTAWGSLVWQRRRVRRLVLPSFATAEEVETKSVAFA